MLQTRFLSLAALAALAIAGAAVAAESTTSSDLEHYFPIRAALAGDKLEGISDHAAALAKSGDKAVAKAAEAVVKAKDLAEARKGFGELSKAVIAEIERASKAGEKVGEIHVFQCPMAKPFGKWVQETAEIGNPYMGAKMLTCGKQIAAVNAPASDAKKPAGGGCEGDGGCCGGSGGAKK